METKRKYDKRNFVKTFDEFLTKLRDHEIATSTKYVVLKSPKRFGVDQVSPTSNQRIHWNDDIPYFHFGSKIYECHQGKDRNIYIKKKYAEERDRKALMDNTVTKRYSQIQRTKKLDCPATVIVTRVIRIPECKLSGLITKRWEQLKMVKTIKKKIENGDNVGEHGFIFSLPTIEQHSDHFIGTHNILELDDIRLECSVENEESNTPQELPLMGSDRQQLINNCRSTWKSLESMLWNLGEEELKTVETTLKEIYTTITSNVTADENSGLVVQTESVLSHNIKSVQNDHGKLALGIKKGSNGRVGKRKVMRKESSKLNIEDQIPLLELAGNVYVVQYSPCMKT